MTTSKVLSMLITFISSVAFANLLPESTYGTYRYILSIAGLLSLSTLQGMNVAMTQAIAKGENVSYQETLNTQIKWGVIGMVIALIGSGYYFLAGDEILSMAFLAIALFIPFKDPFHLYTGILQGQKKFNILARDEVVTRALTMILVVALIFYTKNILLIVIAYLASTTILRFIFLKLAVRKEPSLNQTNSDMLSYGKHISANRFITTFATQIDKILLFQNVGAAALATYYLAFMPFKQSQGFLNSLAMLALPKFSSNSAKNLKKTLPKKILKTYLLIIPAVILYIVLAPYLFGWFYPKYMDAVLISQILMLQLLLFPTALLKDALVSQRHVKKLYVSSTFYAVMRITLVVILVPMYGMYGALAAVISTNVVANLMTVYLFYRM